VSDYARQAEEVLTDVVLIRMIAHGSVEGPYRPTNSLIGELLRWLVGVLFYGARRC
jgi:hypothetical protein